MLESKIQSKIIKKLELNGFYVLKIIRANKNGCPDILAVKDGKATFIEVKRPDGVLSELQKLRIKELQRFGCEVKVWTDFQIDFK
jgi:Holliday junction resolvase